MSERQWFERDGRAYEWQGGFGAIFTSTERGVPQGTVRMIADRPFYAYISKSSSWRKGRVCWTLPKVSAEAVRVLRAELFGVTLWELARDVAAVDPQARSTGTLSTREEKDSFDTHPSSHPSGEREG